ncbi:MAG TPA: TIGR03619 family F420-dependent LLM class oxidoreductase [Trebonia sp.]|nr:TIGR03619 family F420-dependent LLM class oxidoreductase [Trebonia sp.]
MTPQTALHYFATDRSLPVADFARAAAERGFDAVLLPEHTHIPLCTEAPYPGGGELPERYRRTLDPYVALSVIAAQTDLEIGTCVSLVAQHDPIALAKTIATLDFISCGRFSLGVGYGWNLPELANHGRDAAKRRAIVREHVGLMRALWRDAEAEFHGDHANLSPSWAWPKPVRQPSVPVLLGCRLTPSGSAEVVRWADGWIGYGSDLDLFAAQATALRAQWAAAGRAAAGPLIRPMLGLVDDDTLRRSFDRFRLLGVDQVVLDLQAVDGDILGVLDRYAAALASIRSLRPRRQLVEQRVHGQHPGDAPQSQPAAREDALVDQRGVRAGVRVSAGVGADGDLVPDVHRPPGGGQHGPGGRHPRHDQLPDARLPQQRVQVGGGERADGRLAEHRLVRRGRHQRMDLVLHAVRNHVDHRQPGPAGGRQRGRRPAGHAVVMAEVLDDVGREVQGQESGPRRVVVLAAHCHRLSFTSGIRALAVDPNCG